MLQYYLYRIAGRETIMFAAKDDATARGYLDLMYPGAADVYLTRWNSDSADGRGEFEAVPDGDVSLDLPVVRY